MPRTVFSGAHGHVQGFGGQIAGLFEVDSDAGECRTAGLADLGRIVDAEDRNLLRDADVRGAAGVQESP